MKKLILSLIVVLYGGVLSILSQTPYDNFAPEQNVKPMIELPQTPFRITNTNTEGEIQYMEFDNNTFSLILLDENYNILKTLVISPNEKKFLTIDPLAEKYYSVTPYAFCLNNPVRFIDPDGMDVYRYDDNTGEMILYQETDDEFDQIGKFKYDKKTDTYTLRTNRKGEAKTRMDNIEKGILSDGMNFMNNDNIWEIGSPGQPTIEGFQNFVIGFAEMINKEVAGYYMSQVATPDIVSHIYMGRHVDNSATSSYKGFGPWVHSPQLHGVIRPHTDWHTHPSYEYTNSTRTTPSPADRSSKANALMGHPSDRPSYFMILTRGYAPIYY